MTGVLTARKAGLARCHVCGALSPLSGKTGVCPRCGSTLSFRAEGGLERTWALLVAAIILYIPANLLPMMVTSSLFGQNRDTIMSGVVYFWNSGSWDLAAIIFTASIGVPVFKLCALTLLAVSVWKGWGYKRKWRLVLYRIVEWVGRWSMLDVFVVALMVGLVRFQKLATIEAGPAAAAFGAVVVLTMLAAKSFDPRLIWDEKEKESE